MAVVIDDYDVMRPQDARRRFLLSHETEVHRYHPRKYGLDPII